MCTRHLLGWSWVLLLTLVACKKERVASAEAPSQAPKTEAKVPSPLDRPLVRLGEVLAEATIDSPMRKVDAPPTTIKSERVLHEGFEHFSRAEAHWQKAAGCYVVPSPGRERANKALVYKGEGAHLCLFVLPATPSSYYRLHRAISTGDDNVDLRVIELRVGLSHPSTLNHPDDVARVLAGRFVRMKDLLYVHRFLRPRGDRSWETATLELHTTPFTHSLVLLVHDAEDAVSSQRDTEVYFDDLDVERLLPNREQELALLKGEYAAEGADEALGMYKHGQLLPIGNVATVAPPYDSNYDYRYGILAVAPTDITYRLLPRGRTLHFSVGLLKGSQPGDAATFRVLARVSGDEKKLYEKTLSIGARGENWHWYEGRIDLSELGGQEVELVLQTRAPKGSRGLAVWGSPVLDTLRKPGDPPNVVLIGLDTTRADRLSAYGYRRLTSPRLAALAKDGVLFAQATSSSNWTSPSFASIFTGLPPSQHQVIHRARAIAPEVSTLAEHFARGGWATGAVVFKAYLYNMGFEQGFDTWFNVPRYDVRADDNLKKALAWLDDNYQRRFFFFLHFNDPHQPFNQPPPFDHRFNTAADLARFGLKLPIVIEPSGGVRGCSKCAQATPAFRKLARDLYDGELAYMDDRIGKLIDGLKERGLYDDTIIAVVGDHGELMWEHGNYYGHGGPYMYDELTHVPLIIKPARQTTARAIRPGTVVDAQVRAFDVFPSLLELAGLPKADDVVSAETLSPLWNGGKTDEGRVAVSENIKQHIVSVRARGRKLVLSYPPGQPPRQRLFDLRHDPQEQKDVLAADGATAQRLRAQLVQFLLHERRGRYVLVLGDGKMHSYTVKVDVTPSLRAVRSLLGVPLVKKSGGKLDFYGGLSSPIVLFAHLEGPETMRASVHVQASGIASPVMLEEAAFAPFEEVSLQPSDDASVQVHLFTVSASQLAGSRRQKINGERLDALRALGYIE